jgi:hypothetical protein
MTLRMADGPVANLPAGLDAYAGYSNKSGIGITYPGVVAKFPNAQHLSITTNRSPAMCADSEKGDPPSWVGYDYGYCQVSSVNQLIAQYGRPKKLWTAHYDARFGKHICSPHCWPGLVTTADGTQWTDHGGAWDESVLADDFFVLVPGPPPPPPGHYPGDNMQSFNVAVQVAGGGGWFPSPVNAAKFVSAWFAVENPDVVGHYDNVPIVVEASATAGPHSPNGVIVVKGEVPDGTYTVVTWFVD